LLRLLQSVQHHAQHHSDHKNSHYCVITDFVNPLVDGIGLWSGLEWLIQKLTGLQRREDTSIAAPAQKNGVTSSRHCSTDAAACARCLMKKRRAAGVMIIEQTKPNSGGLGGVAKVSGGMSSTVVE